MGMKGFEITGVILNYLKNNRRVSMLEKEEIRIALRKIGLST